MKNSSKRKAQLISELEALEKRVEELESERGAFLRAERALWQYWSLLDAVLASSPDIFGLKGLDGAYVAASPTFCALVGNSEDEISGRGDFELFPREVAEAGEKW